MQGFLSLGKASFLVEKAIRIGTLEGVDGLLLVAHRELRARIDGALDPGPSAEFGDQRIDDFPLGGAGILRLVEQDMGQPAIELVKYPFGQPA